METVASRQAEHKSFTTMLEEISQIAHAKLPQPQHSRLEMGHALVRQGTVFPEDDGEHYTVCSQDWEEAHSWWVNGTCPCPDAQHKAPHGRCKHWMAALLYRRTIEELTRPPAPKSSPAIDPRWIELISGKPFIKFEGLLHLAHARGIVELTTTSVLVTETLAVCQSVVQLTDGPRITDIGDATPTNVKKHLAPHFPRMAATRAAARALRRALNIEIVAAEELGDD